MIFMNDSDCIIYRMQDDMKQRNDEEIINGRDRLF
jgi:hypothetical protein